MMVFRVVLAFGGLFVGAIAAVAYATTHWQEAKEGVEELSSYMLGLWAILFGTAIFFTSVLLI